MDKAEAKAKILSFAVMLESSVGRLASPLRKVLMLVAEQATEPEAIADIEVTGLFETSVPKRIQLVDKKDYESDFWIVWANTKFYLVWNGYKSPGRFPTDTDIKGLYSDVVITDVRDEIYPSGYVILEISEQDGLATPIVLLSQGRGLKVVPFNPPTNAMNGIITAMSNVLYEAEIRIGNQLINRYIPEITRY